MPKPYVSIRDFYREFHYGLHLSAHKNIVTTFDVAFETAGFYVFCQEYAPLGKNLQYSTVCNKVKTIDVFNHQYVYVNNLSMYRTIINYHLYTLFTGIKPT